MDIQNFETAYLNAGGKASELEKEDGEYVSSKAQMGWQMWQEAKAQAVPEWISIKEKTPPTDETVLVCWDYHPDVEPEKEYITLDEDLNEYWPNCEDEPPTHWKLIPKPPKAQEQGHDSN